jgi:hypothetical protein
MKRRHGRKAKKSVMMFPVMVALSFKVWLELTFCKKNMAGWHDVRSRRYQSLLKQFFHLP